MAQTQDKLTPPETNLPDGSEWKNVERSAPPVSNLAFPRSFFNETVELLRGYTPAIGGLDFGCDFLHEELGKHAAEPVFEAADRIQCVRFPSGKGRQRIPSLCVAFASKEIEQATKNYRHALVIVTDMSAFLQTYPKGQNDPRLKNVCLGGFVNLGTTNSVNTSGFALALLNAWILCGPFFDPFREREALDLRFSSRHEAFFRALIQTVINCWNANLQWYYSEEERVLRIRNKADGFRKTSSTFLTFSQKEEVFQTRVAEWLRRTDDMERLPLTHSLGWDDKNRRWDLVSRQMLEPEEVLSVVEKKQPAFAFETNCFNSPLQTFYHGGVSPAFLLSRCGIPHHHMITDPVIAVNTAIWDLFAEMFSRTATAFFYTPNSNLPNAVKKVSCFFPSLILADTDASFKGKASTVNYAVSCVSSHVLGFFIATNFRRETVGSVHVSLRRIVFFLSNVFRKHIRASKMSYYTFFQLLLEDNASMISVLLEYMKNIPFEVFCATGTLMGRMVNLLQGLEKLTVAVDVIKFSKKLGVPVRIHCHGQWVGGNKDIWRGYIPKDQVETLGRSGWVRISPQPQLAGEPFHDMHDALQNGYVCLGVNAHREEEEDFQSIAPCTFSTASVLYDRMTEAFSDPAGMFEAMKRAASAGGKIPNGERRAASSDVCGLLRRFPYEGPTTGAPVNNLSLAGLSASLEEIREELPTLKAFLADPQGIPRFITKLPEEEREYATLIKSYLDV